MQFEKTLQFTVKDIVIAYRFHLRSSRSIVGRYSSIALGIFLCAVNSWVIYQHKQIGSDNYEIWPSFLGIFLILFHFLWPVVVGYFTFKTNTQYHQPCHFVFSDTELKMESAGSSTRFLWSAFYKARAGDEAVLFYCNKVAFYAFLPHEFSEEEFRWLREMAEEQVPKKK